MADHDVHRIVGTSRALAAVLDQADAVANTEATVLILGETGVGKELIARRIHDRSAHQAGPLVTVNCASIPHDLFESEMFGHVRGAFTGANRDRVGRIESAAGGTLLLDEVGEIPAALQAKLLRVLQERRFERIGEDRSRHETYASSQRPIVPSNRKSAPAGSAATSTIGSVYSPSKSHPCAADPKTSCRWPGTF